MNLKSLLPIIILAVPIFIPAHLGTMAFAGEPCGRVDIYIPHELVGKTEAPTLIDPNASITARLTPGASDCQIWHYHNLKKGQKPPISATPPLTAKRPAEWLEPL